MKAVSTLAVALLASLNVQGFWVPQTRLVVIPRSNTHLPPSSRCTPTCPSRTSSSSSHASSTTTRSSSSSSSSTPTMAAAATTTTSSDSFVGSTLTDMQLAYEAAAKFFESTEGVEFKQTSGGVNNVGMYVSFPDGRHYVMRIYNNGFNHARVHYEHTILKQLNEQKLSFAVPKALPVLHDPTMTYTVLSNGADACVFETIPGSLPKLTCVQDIGRASGELLEAIQKVDVSHLECPTAPYSQFYDVHHAITRESFYREMAGPDFDAIRASATKAVAYIEDMERKLESFEAKKLPKTLLHADLHYDNVLVQDGKVTGLLDFEFAAVDYRAMELAVCLSKYAGEPKAKEYFDDFIKGYMQHAHLTDAEIEAIPTLVNLRILSNVAYFVGRKLAGEDDISSITTRLENYMTRVDWVYANADAIIGKLKEEAKKAK